MQYLGLISWKNTNFDVRIFSVYISESEEIQNLDWDFPTYAMSSVRKVKISMILFTITTLQKFFQNQLLNCFKKI